MPCTVSTHIEDGVDFTSLMRPPPRGEQSHTEGGGTLLKITHHFLFDKYLVFIKV